MKKIILTGILLIFLSELKAKEKPAEYSLYFGGARESVDVPNLVLPDKAAQLAVEFRFKTLVKVKRSLTLVSCWSENSKEADKGSFFVGLRSSNLVLFGFCDQKGVAKTFIGKGVWNDGRWHHVVASLDGEKATIYLDGKSITSQKLKDFESLAGSKRPLIIGPPGALKASREVPFEGYISDVAVWGVARNLPGISRSREKPLSGKEPGLAAYFPMREASPSSKLIDESKAGLEGQLTDRLARVGWCVTPLWYEPEREGPSLDLFGYDLSAHARPVEDEEISSLDISTARRQILVGNEKSGQAGVLWQDKDTDRIYLTWVDPGFSYHETVPVKGMTDGRLVAGTTDPKGNLYYFVIEQSPSNRPESVTLKAMLYLSDSKGKALRECPVDMSKDGFNVYKYGGRWMGSMSYSKGMLGLIFPRTYYKSSDGLRHQAAVAATFPANLSKVQKVGQTSSHSFGNFLVANLRGGFIGMDLGDNYPRGINLHKITGGQKASRIIFTFKTSHGTSPKGDSPVYEEISGNGKTFYKWSNDNGTYSELGGIVEGKMSYSVIFSTDRSPAGKVLDNSRVKERDDPRDLALLRVSKSFERAPGGNEVSDSIMVGIPKGAVTETGGFYDYGGKWRKQRITGVIWLTKYKEGESVHAPQTIRLRDGNILVIWEKADADASSLYSMTVSESGKIESGPIRLGLDFKLNRGGAPLRVEDRIFLLAKDEGTDRTRLCFVNDE